MEDIERQLGMRRHMETIRGIGVKGGCDDRGGNRGLLSFRDYQEDAKIVRRDHCGK